MRTLLLFRGAPGCGKSTFIKNSGLENYTLSADSIRMMCCSPTLDASGNPQISQKRDKIVWNMLFQMLESRMQNGDFNCVGVIDEDYRGEIMVALYNHSDKDFEFKLGDRM